MKKDDRVLNSRLDFQRPIQGPSGSRSGRTSAALSLCSQLLAEALNTDGVTTRLGKRWSTQSVKRLMRDIGLQRGKPGRYRDVTNDCQQRSRGNP